MIMGLRVATRKSALALAQTKLVADATGEPYELVPMTTEGDRRLDRTLASFGGKGVFIKELEVALLEGRADIAVHSLKDMPSEVMPEFRLAAVMKREDPRDAFWAKGGAEGLKFMELPAGARVGTGSIRRVAQLKAVRPDLEYVPVRGNIQTRISKLEELDGVVLAAAGLKRMGLADRVTEYFDTDMVLPASGQGILAVETLKDVPDDVAAAVARINDADTYCVAVAEMAYLKALNAGCQFPVASFAEFEDASPAGAQGTASRTMVIRGFYWDETGSRSLRAESACEIPQGDEPARIAAARDLGIRLAQAILAEL